jgi:diacylglycerol kinase family enzyme
MRGVRPIVLHPGDDLRALAEQAAADGADVIGMAGGDGSQALVAEGGAGSQRCPRNSARGHAQPLRARSRA